MRIDDDYEEQVRTIYSPLAPTDPIGGTGYPLPGPGIYDRYPTFYGATGSFRDYENQLIARRGDRSRIQ